MSSGGCTIPKDVWDAIVSAPSHIIKGPVVKVEILNLQPILAQKVPAFLNTINLYLENNPFSILTEFDQWYAWTLRLIKMKATVLEWERTTNP